MTVLVHFPRTSLMASCPIKDATYKIIIKERFVENHVLGIGNFFFNFKFTFDFELWNNDGKT